MKICFAASSGGHFEQLMTLKKLMKKYDSFILTEKISYQIADPEIPAHYILQVNRKELLFIPKMIWNTWLSFLIFLREKPEVIICTGVLSTIPMCLIGKVFHKKLIYIESFAKVETSTETGKLMYKFANQFYVQWKQMLKIYPEAIYKGGIY